MSEVQQVGGLLTVVVALAFFGWILSLFFLGRPKETNVPDDFDQPYSVFTREFDVELKAIELRHELVRRSPDLSRGWYVLSREAWQREVEAAKEIYSAWHERFSGRAAESKLDAKGQSVTILIDQSGSMKGESIHYAAATARLASEVLATIGAQTEILGFSTAGWQGGFARQKWISTGRLFRPGRVCAILHIIYKAFDEPMMTDQSWEAMLDPNVLRENVDGEAIEWAVARLRTQHGARRHLLIISDGAPVDDATHSYNGPTYLSRHLATVLSSILEVGDVEVDFLRLEDRGKGAQERDGGGIEPYKLPIEAMDWIVSRFSSQRAG